MSADSAVLAGRRMIEAEMKSTCTIRRQTGTTVDDETGEEVPTWDTVYTGKCRLKFPNALAGTVNAAGQILATQNPVLSLPVEGSGGVLTDDVATMDSNPLDESVVGMVLRIAGAHGMTQGTARRFPVEVISNV